MTKQFYIAFTALLIAGVLVPSFAQYDDEGPSRFGIRILNLFPLDNDLRDVDSVWLGPAVDYHLKFDEEDMPLSYLSLGIMSADKPGIDISRYQLTYTKLHRTPISADRTKYVGYGIGAYRLKLRLGWMGTDATYLPGVAGVYGQEFGEAYFAEMRVELLPGWKDRDWSGIYLSVGTRVSL